MSFDRQARLVGDLPELRPIAAEDFEPLFRVASDPRIREQHPDNDRWQEPVFRAFFADALNSGGALVAVEKLGAAFAGSTTDAKGGERVVDELTTPLHAGAGRPA